MLKPETVRALADTMRHLGEEVLRLTQLHDGIETVLQEYGEALAQPNGDQTTTRKKPPSVQAREDAVRLPRRYDSEARANKCAGAHRRFGRKVRVVLREGSWVVEEIA